jgi:two-component system sensor histidine kinase KdpD
MDSFFQRQNLKMHLFCLGNVLLICAGSTLLSLFVYHIGVAKENVLMIFLLGVLLTTVFTKGYFYGLLSAVISVFLFNFFFTEPLHTMAIRDPQDMLLMVFFLIAASICGAMSSKFREQASIAKENQKTTQLMYEITESFLNLTGTENIVMNGIRFIHDHTKYDCCVRLDSGKFDTGNTEYKSEGYEASEDDPVFPIQGLASVIGTLSVNRRPGKPSEEHTKLFQAVVHQMAIVLDREFIYLEREKIRLAMEKEHLKTSLLRSLSHDIRTPLTAISGASGLIIDNYDSLSDEEVLELAKDIHEDSSMFMLTAQNILDMTRITDGRMEIKKNYEAADDLIGQAAAQTRTFLEGNELQVHLPEEILMVRVDGTLIVQVLVNLISNACKHAGGQVKIELSVYRSGGDVVFECADNGHGIDEGLLGTLFDDFVTLPRNMSDKGRGVGLGLSICKAIVEAHGGRITAENRASGGAVFRFYIPDEEAEETEG